MPVARAIWNMPRMLPAPTAVSCTVSGLSPPASTVTESPGWKPVLEATDTSWLVAEPPKSALTVVLKSRRAPACAISIAMMSSAVLASPFIWAVLCSPP